jgi:hypothetical protein
MSESEMRACLERLDQLRAGIKAVEAVFGDKRQLFGSDRQRAQELLAEIKTRLKQEYRRTSAERGRSSLNPVEQAFYSPAVHEAITKLRVKTNSIPNASWLSELYDAAGDIEHYASQLREQLGQ